MIIKFHKGLTLERWNALTYQKQVLNIASELTRAKNWIQKKDFIPANESIERALELIDLTVESRKVSGALKELLRFREVLAGFYVAHPEDTEYSDFLVLMNCFLDFDECSHSLRSSS